MREGNRDVGRERVPHISQLIGHSRSSRYQNPFSKTLTMKFFSSRNCTSGYISHPILYIKKIYLKIVCNLLCNYWFCQWLLGQGPLHEILMRKRMMEGWGCHNLKALANQYHKKGDNQVFCVSWCDGYKTYSAIYAIFVAECLTWF